MNDAKMGTQDVELSRRDLANTMLALLGAGVGTSILASCTNQLNSDGSNESVDEQQLAVGMGARIDYASAVGIRPNTVVGVTPTTNSTAIVNWQNDPQKANYTLVFDETGVYDFNVSTVRVKPCRRYTTNAGATIRAPSIPAGHVGDKFVVTLEGGGVAAGSIAGLKIDASGPDGNPLVDYGLYISTGNVGFASSVTVSKAKVYGIWALTATVVLDDCSVTHSQLGVLLTASSESIIRNLYVESNSTVGLQIQSGANGGRAHIFSVRAANNPTCGIDFDAVQECDVHGATVEGSSIGIRMRKRVLDPMDPDNPAKWARSTGIQIYGYRCNAGSAVVFDAALSCQVHGVCDHQCNVVHSVHDVGCFAFLRWESNSVAGDITHTWPSPPGPNPPDPWNAYCRHDGWISLNDAPPTIGTWRKGDVVWASSPVSGQPMGWRCAVDGIAPPSLPSSQWKAMPNYP